MLPDRAKSPEGDIEVKESENKGAHVSLNDSRLQGFILSLQEDLRVLLERQEAGMTERRVLMEQLQEAQEKNQLLACKMEGMKAETDQLKLSETSLMEEVEVLREENQRLQREATNQTPLQSSSDSESTRLSLCAKLASLVLKCQERNGLLLQMMGAMQRCGCMDPTLAQQVEHLLSDVALQDYSMAFTPRNHIRKQDACSRFTQELISNFKVPNLLKVTCPAESSYVCSEENKDQCAQKEQQSLICVNETSTNLQTCRDSAADVAETQTKHSPVKERASRRLSSPEKILNMHEELQRTLMSTFQVHGHYIFSFFNLNLTYNCFNLQFGCNFKPQVNL
uniref:Uncharacterized protein n=1 Tax=Oryzias latipes TaxID=8090 RepID=A0A3P9IGI2_ORYLA